MLYKSRDILPKPLYLFVSNTFSRMYLYLLRKRVYIILYKYSDILPKGLFIYFQYIFGDLLYILRKRDYIILYKYRDILHK